MHEAPEVMAALMARGEGGKAVGGEGVMGGGRGARLGGEGGGPRPELRDAHQQSLLRVLVLDAFRLGREKTIK